MEAYWFKSCLHGDLRGEMPVVVCLSLGGRDVADRLQQSVMVEPRYPFERGEFQRFPGLPGCSAMDQFRLVNSVNRFGRCVVVAADRRLDAGLGKPFAVPDGHVLRSPVRVMDQAVSRSG